MADGFETIEVDHPRDGVTRITLARPKQLNAYTWAMTQELQHALAAFRDDDARRALIVTGAGDRGFCAGGDLSGAEPEHRRAVAAAPMGGGREMREGMQAVIAMLRRLDKPSVAAIRGAAVAGGLALALACDFRIAGPDARLGDTSTTFGLLPDEGGAWLFPAAMGRERALRMSLLGEVHPAAEALRLGLVDEVVDGDPVAAALDLAQRLAGRPPLATRLTKMMYRAAESDAGLERAFEAAQLAVMIANPGAEARALIGAFRDRRTPPPAAG